MYFIGSLKIEEVRKGRLWKTLDSFTYVASGNQRIQVPEGFKTDGASIPRIFWTIVGHPMSRYAQAAVVHDYLYHIRQFTRARSDEVFLEAMEDLKVPFYKRYPMWLYVRSFGWVPWNKYKKAQGKSPLD